MSNSQQITGKIAFIKPAEQKGEYSLRSFFLDISNANPQTGEVYENILALQLFGDKCSILDNFQVGQSVTVSYNLKGGKDKTTQKWRWVNISPWKIELAQASQAQTPAPVAQTSAPVPQHQQNLSNQNTQTTTQKTAAPAMTEVLDGDLPF